MLVTTHLRLNVAVGFPTSHSNLLPQVTKVVQVSQEHLAFPVSLELKVTKDFPGTRADKGSQESEACLDTLWKGQRETEAALVHKENQVSNSFYGCYFLRPRVMLFLTCIFY